MGRPTKICSFNWLLERNRSNILFLQHLPNWHNIKWGPIYIPNEKRNHSVSSNKLLHLNLHIYHETTNTITIVMVIRRVFLFARPKTSSFERRNRSISNQKKNHSKSLNKRLYFLNLHIYLLHSSDFSYTVQYKWRRSKK